MATKANIAVGGNELTIYFVTGDGKKSKVCHYCGKPGHEVAVYIDSIECDGILLSKNEQLYRQGIRKFRKLMFHGRGICALDGGHCCNQLLEDQLHPH